MSALAVVRWLTLNDPDVATLVLGEAANLQPPADPVRETAGQNTTLSGVLAEPVGGVLQPVADSPHDPPDAFDAGRDRW